jgi:hypothetical protein
MIDGIEVDFSTVKVVLEIFVVLAEPFCGSLL